MVFNFNPFELELLIRLVLSLVFGGIVGFEREMTRKPAGLRTHMLVCLGACLFTVSSFFISPSPSGVDLARIAAGVVTGIGFIGAGSIIAKKGDVKGLTTAASLWLVAAIGLTLGMGNYLIPLVGAVLGFFILRMGKVERELEEKKKKEDKVL